MWEGMVQYVGIRQYSKVLVYIPSCPVAGSHQGTGFLNIHPWYIWLHAACPSWGGPGWWGCPAGWGRGYCLTPPHSHPPRPYLQFDFLSINHSWFLRPTSRRKHCRYAPQTRHHPQTIFLYEVPRVPHYSWYFMHFFCSQLIYFWVMQHITGSMLFCGIHNCINGLRTLIGTSLFRMSQISYYQGGRQSKFMIQPSLYCIQA